MDAAGNESAASGALLITVDTTAPAVPSAPDLDAASDTGTSDTDNITSDTTPSFTGTAAANAEVRLYAGATLLGNTTADASGNWSCTVTPALVNGTYSVTAKTVDTAGNESAASDALSITVDTSVPATPSAPDLTSGSDTGALDTDNITSDTTPTFAGTAAANAEVHVFRNSLLIGTTTADASGNWSFTLTSPLGDMSYTFNAKVVNAAGVSSFISSTLIVTIDTTAPEAPSSPDLTSGSDTGALDTDNITSDTTPTLTGTAPANATVYLYSGETLLGSTTADGSGNWSYTVSPLTDGTYSVTAKAEDAAGNVSAASSALSLTIDTTAPDAPAAPDLVSGSDTGTLDTDNITSDTTPTLSGTASANATVYLYSGGAQVDSTTADGSGDWSFTASTLASGTYLITAKAVDAAGNVSAASAALSLTIDTVAPEISGVTDGTTYDITVTPEFSNATATLQKGTGAELPFTSGTEIAENGSYVLTVTDLAGNESSASFTVFIPTAPTAPQNVTVTPGNGQAEIRFDPPADDGGSEITQYIVSIYRHSDSTLVTFTTLTSPYTATQLQNGEEYTFSVAAENGVGSTDSDEITVRIGRPGKAITATAIGELLGGGIIHVPLETKVSDLLVGISVSDGAFAEIISGAGGTPVPDQSTTDVTAEMKVLVTAENGLTAEYTIAVDIPAYTVTFISNGGTQVPALTGVAPGSTILAPTPPIRISYTFIGWYKNAGLTLPWDFASDTVNADITLYAQWESVLLPPIPPSPPAPPPPPTSPVIPTPPAPPRLP